MAIFQAFNTAGIGFNMTSTDSSGWAFMVADPDVVVDTVHDDGAYAIFDVYGSSFIDRFSANYWSNGYDVVIDELNYEYGGNVILSIKDLNLHATIDSLEGNAWYVSLNGDQDTFYGNDYDDIIRAGYGDDDVYGYGGNDIIYGDDGSDLLLGVAGDDDLYGGSGSDILDGGPGRDYLSGGWESDTLTGGPGNDYFVFDVRPNRGNIDRIVDFKPTDDTIMLDNAVFTRIGRDGWLSGAAFTTGSAAKDASDRVIYNKKTGALLYDPDGAGGVAATKIALLQKGLHITKADFYVL